MSFTSFGDFSRVVQISSSGMAPENCYCHRDGRDNQDLSLMTVPMQCKTLQTASKTLYQKLQNAARGLGYKPRAKSTKSDSMVVVSVECGIKFWVWVEFGTGYWFCWADRHTKKDSLFLIT